jgi:hypothetical protein
VLALFILLPWVAARHRHPAEAWSVTAMYREMEAVHPAMIAAIGQPTLGETADHEHAGQGVRGFPMASTAPHGLGYALFGAPGYLVADLAMAGGYLVVLRWLLHILGLGAGPATAVALLLACRVAVPLSNLCGDQVPTFWGERLPRPFNTEVYATAVLALLVALVRWPQLRTSRWLWALLGLGLAVTLQGEPYWVVPLGCAAGLLLGWSLLHRSASWPVALWWVGGGLLTGAPFLLQRLTAHPDVARRLGVFPLRLAELPWPWELYARSGPWVASLQVVVVLGLCLGLWRRWRGSWPGRLAGAAALLVILAAVAPWLQVGLTGTAIQLYHYEDILCRCLSLALVGLAVAAASRISATWRLHRTLGLLLLGLLLAGRFALDVPHALNRPDSASIAFAHRTGADVGAGYREDFAALTAILAREHADGARVLATLDTQVNGWWVGFLPGACTLLPDPCFSTLDDRTLERRLMQYASIMGYAPAEFAALIREPCVLLYQLGSGKYQSGKAFRFDPADPGPAHARRFTDPWGLYLPAAEAARLTAAYDAGGTTADRCDLIVTDTAETHRPAAQVFTEAWRNRRFAVWRRNRM